MPVGTRKVTRRYPRRMQQFFGDTADDHNLIRKSGNFALDDIDGAIGVPL
jgi:hypothetical protein